MLNSTVDDTCKMKISLIINNKKKNIVTPPNRTLIEVLRAQGCWSVKYGCETGNCGNCTVLIEGKAVYSCLMLAAQADGKSIETFENVQNNPAFRPLVQAFMDYGELECGYCNAGMVMAAKALLDENPSPGEQEILEALSGNVCRCTQQPLPVEHILEAIDQMRGKW